MALGERAGDYRRDVYEHYLLQLGLSQSTPWTDRYPRLRDSASRPHKGCHGRRKVRPLSGDMMAERYDVPVHPVSRDPVKESSLSPFSDWQCWLRGRRVGGAYRQANVLEGDGCAVMRCSVVRDVSLWPVSCFRRGPVFKANARVAVGQYLCESL